MKRALAPFMIAFRRARSAQRTALASRWQLLELVGWLVVAAGAADVYRPLGLLVVGYVLIVVANQRAGSVPAPEGPRSRTIRLDRSPDDQDEGFEP